MHRKTIFEKVAEKFHTTRKRYMRKSRERVDAGYDNPDPEVRAEWRRKVKNKKGTDQHRRK